MSQLQDEEEFIPVPRLTRKGPFGQARRKLEWSSDKCAVDSLSRSESEKLTSVRSEMFQLRRTVSVETLSVRHFSNDNKENINNSVGYAQPTSPKPQLPPLEVDHPCHALQPPSESERTTPRSPVMERRLSKRMAPYPAGAAPALPPPTKPHRARGSSLLSPLSVSTPSFPFYEANSPSNERPEEDRPATSPSKLSQSSSSPSKEGPLPVLPSSATCDLASISPETTATLVSGKYSHAYEHVIVDCRFPYEYDGGHIKNAVNLQTPQDIEETFLRYPINGRKVIIVFHCEFSSHRGPTLCRLLRSLDRSRNIYPNLFYPHVYLLDGGYKEFFLHYQQLCTPQQYVTMRDSAHAQEMKKALSTFRRNTQPSKMKRSYSTGCITAFVIPATEPNEGKRPSSLRSTLSVSMVELDPPSTPQAERVCAEDTPDSKLINREVQRLRINVGDETILTANFTTSYTKF